MWVSSALIFLYIYTYKKSPLATASRHPSSMQCWCLFVCLFVITAPIFLLPWILALSVSLAGWRARLLETFWVRSLWWFVFGWGIFVMSGGGEMDGWMDGWMCVCIHISIQSVSWGYGCRRVYTEHMPSRFILLRVPNSMLNHWSPILHASPFVSPSFLLIRHVPCVYIHIYIFE